tara:strand:+ start:830 stop:1297 length:468 start_codon:yes stop_codon:yes gene_type:complete
MSIESKYIINQINQAPEDFKVDESSYILDKIRKGIVDSTRLRVFGKDISGRQFLPKSEGSAFDSKVQEELTRAYRLYENGEMTNDEFKYIEASFEELKKDKEGLILRNATFGVAPTTKESIEMGGPRYKLIVMQDKNPFTEGLPEGNTIMPEDFI